MFGMVSQIEAWIEEGGGGGFRVPGVDWQRFWVKGSGVRG